MLAVLGVALSAVAAFFLLRQRGSSDRQSGNAIGLIGVVLNATWSLVLAGLGLFNQGSLDPQWRTALLFVALTAVPLSLAGLGLRGRPRLLLAAGIVCVPLSLMSLAGATLPLLLPALCYFTAYHRRSPEPNHVG